MTFRLPAALFALALTVPLGSAQDKKEEKKDAAQQKAVLVANLKRADLAKATVVETQNFLIATTLPAEKGKVLGAMLEKVVPVAMKGLQFEEKEEPWKGKLAVVYLPDSRDFKSFMRNIVGGESTGAHYALRANEPFVVDPVEVTTNATEADRFARTTAVVAGAFMKGKAGTASIPNWLLDGFGRVTAMRAESTTGKRYTAYKTAARLAAGARGGKSATLGDLWAESRPENLDVLANSFSEYLAYGPGKENFIRLLFGFRPNENGTTPSAPQALEAAGWKDIPMLEKAWQKWAATGR